MRWIWFCMGLIFAVSGWADNTATVSGNTGSPVTVTQTGGDSGFLIPLLVTIVGGIIVAYVAKRWIDKGQGDE